MNTYSISVKGDSIPNKRKILHLSFVSQYELVATFMRLQEFYECPDPDIRDHWFSIPQFMDSYAARHGNFTYFTDWAAFNVPGYSVDKFFSRFSDLTMHEENLKEQLNSCGKCLYYVIGTCLGSDDVDHELAHAFWYLHPGYKEEMEKLLKFQIHSSSTCMMYWLREEGYNEDQLLDEMQAYFATSSLSYLKEECKVDTEWNILSNYRDVFKKYKKLLKYDT